MRNCTNQASQTSFSVGKFRRRVVKRLNLLIYADMHNEFPSTLTAAVKVRHSGKGRERGMSESNG